MEALMYIAIAVLVLGGLMWNTFRLLEFTNRYLERPRRRKDEQDHAPPPQAQDHSDD